MSAGGSVDAALHWICLLADSSHVVLQVGSKTSVLFSLLTEFVLRFWEWVVVVVFAKTAATLPLLLSSSSHRNKELVS